MATRQEEMHHKPALASGVGLIGGLAAAVVALLISASNPQNAAANSLEVGPGGYATIGAAVQAASPGDTILIHAGTYREAVDLSNRAVTVQPFGDGTVVLDEECADGRDAGFYIGGGSGQIIKGLTIKNTVGASIYIEGGASNITIDGNTLIDFDCTYDYVSTPSQWGQYRGGVASYYGGSNITITNNVIQHRSTPNPTFGQWGAADDIWFKSSDATPSGGGHYIAGNTIIGGWDGIGGEPEGSAHGSLDGNSIIENNTVTGCADDGIQVEGGDDNVYVRNNDVSGCGTGIAFAAPIAGPLYVENNYIHDLKTGHYNNLFCYKVGNSSSATAYLTGNVCDVDSAAEVSQGGADGLAQTNSGMFTIISRQNIYHVSRYIFEFGSNPLDYGSTFDYDCLWTTDNTGRFVEWGGQRAYSIEELQQYGIEVHGQQSLDCGMMPTPTPSAAPSRAPTPSPAPTATPSPTPSLTPAASSSGGGSGGPSAPLVIALGAVAGLTLLGLGFVGAIRWSGRGRSTP